MTQKNIWRVVNFCRIRKVNVSFFKDYKENILSLEDKPLKNFRRSSEKREHLCAKKISVGKGRQDTTLKRVTNCKQKQRLTKFI